MNDLVERLRKFGDRLSAERFTVRETSLEAADRIEELEAARQKLIQERFKISAEATAHLEAFGIPWEDDGYTIVGLLISKCEKLMKERDHWKANHDNQVSRARVLMERPDLPIERVEAYNLIKDLRFAVAKLESELVAYRADSARINFMADKCLSRPQGLFHWALTSDTPNFRYAIDRERTK